MADVPSHLIGWTVSEEVETDGSLFQMRLCCPCGSQHFRLLHPGPWSWKTSRSGDELEGYPIGIVVDGHGFFLIRAVCIQCQTDRLVIDGGLHGRLAFVEPDLEQQMAPRPPLHSWRCVKCEAEEHSAVVRYVVHCPEDFAHDVQSRCPGARREDAFVWFGMDIECCRCGWFSWLWVEAEFL